MSRHYEFTIITHPDLGEGDTTKLLGRFESVFERDGGQIVKRDVWGTKKLAYPIRKHFRGRYTFYDLKTTPDNVHEVMRLTGIEEQVLRCMAVCCDTEKKKPSPSARARAAFDSAGDEDGGGRGERGGFGGGRG